MIILLVGSLSTAQAAPEDQPRYPDMDQVLVPGPPHGCITGRLTLLQNLGDLNGIPLELKYLDNSATIQERNVSPTWEEWHKRFAIELNKAFSAQKERVEAQDKLVATETSYVVTQDGKIREIKVSNFCPSSKFRSMIIKTLESLDGNPALQFPSGAKLDAMPKSGRFMQNYGLSIIEKARSSQKTEPRSQS